MPNKRSSQKVQGTFTHNFKPSIPNRSQISPFDFLLAILMVMLVYYLFRYSDVDKILIAAIVALLGIGMEMVSNIFTYFLSIIQSVPYIGPIIVKVITWPIFFTLNAVAYFVTLVVIRFKGMALVKDARILTTIFLIGFLIGFILGRLF
ncbi:MAG: hypothetical protein KBI07_05840 [Candidatus Atribacteria bacterium]|nr:hypothetical protein [Candidatus Atribacteria bacterium]